MKEKARPLMLPTDRLVLIDVENVVGLRSKPRTLRALVTAPLNAAGPRTMPAAYAANDAEDDPTASTLACLGVVPLRMPPGPDAAETALLAHARRMQAERCVLFTVLLQRSRFASFTDGESAHVDELIWEGQPVSLKLEPRVPSLAWPLLVGRSTDTTSGRRSLCLVSVSEQRSVGEGVSMR